MRKKTEDDILLGPLPPLACLDYDEAIKFWERESERFDSLNWDSSILLDWAIRTLLSSLMADSASRIFLSKTRTDVFYSDDLIPLSVIEPTGRASIQLSRVFLVSTLWSNRSIATALCHAAAKPVEEVGDSEIIGSYIKELNLAIVDTAVHQTHAQRFLGHGLAMMDIYSLRDLEPILKTDGLDWVVIGEGGAETVYPVLDTRMAALYTFGIMRYCPR